MSGKAILADTNIILYLLRGSDTLEELLQGKTIYLSFITELELLAFKNISIQEEIEINEFLNDCTILPLNKTIKEKYIETRRNIL